MTSPHLSQSSNLVPEYSYKLEGPQNPIYHSLVGTSNKLNYEPQDISENERKQYDSLKVYDPKDSLGFSSSFQVVQQTIPSVSNDDWQLLKGEIQILRKQISQKTQFYTTLKNKFINNERQWRSQKQRLLNEIQAIKTQKQSQNINNNLHHKQFILRQQSWNKQKNILVSQLVTLRNQLHQFGLIQHQQQQLVQTIQHLNHQIIQMNQHILQGRKRQEAYINNINILNVEVERLSLIYQKTNTMEQQIQKLNQQLQKWYQKSNEIEIKKDSKTIETQQSIKLLKRQNYILQTTNLNLSQQIKKYQQIIYSQPKLGQNINQLKIEAIRLQSQKQNALKEVELLKAELTKQRSQKKIKKKKAHHVQQVQQKGSLKNSLVSPFSKSTINPYNLQTRNENKAIVQKPYETKLKSLRQQTKILRESLKDFA